MYICSGGNHHGRPYLHLVCRRSSGGIACRRSRAWTGMAVCSICGRVGDPACIYETMGIKIYEAASCENKL